MEYKDYYTILGVDRNATQAAIKSAYRKLARRFHPDISKEKNAEERFKELGEAYDVLKDPYKRTAYDQLGAPWYNHDKYSSGPGWKDGYEFTGAGPKQETKSRLSEFFVSLLNRYQKSPGRGKAAKRPRGKDHHARIRIDLRDSYQGANRRITLQIPIQDHYGHIQTTERLLDIRIPKGIKAGQRIRLAGQGIPGTRGILAGDLILEVEFNPHPFFKVSGEDVHLDLPVAPWEAALGAAVKIPTPNGAVELKIPPGSAEGSRVRLKDRGIPGTPNGHLYVTLHIALPPADSEKARSVYRQMAKEFRFDPRTQFGDLG
jgi:curved DNA-binding protein